MLLARNLRALDEGPVRARAAARALSALEPEQAAELLAELIERRSEPDAAAAVAAIGQAMLDPGGFGYDRLADLYAAAVERGLAQVSMLLLTPTAQRPFEEPFDKSDPHLACLTLGHKKSQARLGRDPDRLARLAAEGDPAVVREDH